MSFKEIEPRASELIGSRVLKFPKSWYRKEVGERVVKVLLGMGEKMGVEKDMHQYKFASDPPFRSGEVVDEIVWQIPPGRRIEFTETFPFAIENDSRMAPIIASLLYGSLLAGVGKSVWIDAVTTHAQELGGIVAAETVNVSRDGESNFIWHALKPLRIKWRIYFYKVAKGKELNFIEVEAWRSPETAFTLRAEAIRQEVRQLARPGKEKLLPRTGLAMLTKNNLLKTKIVSQKGSGIFGKEIKINKRALVVIAYGAPGGWGSIGRGRPTAEGTWKVADERFQAVKNWTEDTRWKESFLQEIEVANVTPILPSGGFKAVYFTAAMLGAVKKWQFVQEGQGVRVVPGEKRNGYFVPVANNPSQAATILKEWLFIAQAGRQKERSPVIFGAYKGVAKEVWEEAIARTGLSLDIEHFPGGATTAQEVNALVGKFAEARKKLLGKAVEKVPGFVFVYVVDPLRLGKIVNMNTLRQYYPDANTFVVVLHDGFGAAAAKLVIESRIVQALSQGRQKKELRANPPLVGPMDFRLMWGNKYDTYTDSAAFMQSATAGAPICAIAVQ